MVLLHLVCEDRVYFFINVSLTFINRKYLVVPEIIRTFALQLGKNRLRARVTLWSIVSSTYLPKMLKLYKINNCIFLPTINVF